MKVQWYVDKDNIIPENTVYCYDPNDLVVKHFSNGEIKVEWGQKNESK